MIEAAVLKETIDKRQFESRIPLTKSYDVLVQYLVTLAVGPGFYPEQVFKQVKTTHAYKDLTAKSGHGVLSSSQQWEHLERV